jgi:hypothetical protein
LSVNVNCLLAEAGLLRLRASDRPSYIDMLPETKAFAMDPAVFICIARDDIRAACV